MEGRYFVRVLGLGGSHHDFSACLVEDGRIVSAVEEERLTRKKVGFGLGPRLQRCLAADYVLAEAGITSADVDLVVANDFLNPVYALRFKNRVEWIGHHLAHAASTFHTSPFERAAVLVMDGRGSEHTVRGQRYGETITCYTADEEGLRPLHAVHGLITPAERRIDEQCENSVGGMYEAVAKYIGLRTVGSVGAPGKAMGLAPYGTPRYVPSLAGLYELEDGEFRQSRAQLRELENLIVQELARAPGAEAADEIRADFAFAVQAHAERIVIELARRLYERTGARRLCMAGGVALNSVANYRILEETPFDEIHIIPAAGDSGTSVGAALYGHYGLGQRPWAPVPFSPYLGTEYSEERIRAAIAPYGDLLRVEHPGDLFVYVAGELANGAVVGWFQGRSEIGPRALGNRSILADPRSPDMKDRINAKVKHREWFRPFAPVVLHDRQTEYFTSGTPALYMLLVPHVLPDKQAVIPAVTHVDGSARLQTAVPGLNPRLCDLLTAFDRITGVPVLLNTSFNDNEEPIVETPEDALRCFLATDMDLLALGDTVLRKAGEA
ncbi:carbamoyltransferase [Streptomyces sp. NPDC056987]|uniref:carbamoyltransferase family protein n=1 Tax=Streptomyces sp. NPDC056987 TaxID=3345988 RepID=UPI003640A40F